MSPSSSPLPLQHSAMSRPVSGRECPVVCGTTGWNERREEAEKLCEELDGTFFWSSNFSIGVNILFRVSEYLARIMDRFPEYAVSMREVHHTRKKDAPSGTAVTLAEGILRNIGRTEAWVNHETDCPSALGIVSVREGDVAGIHEVIYDSVAVSSRCAMRPRAPRIRRGLR